MNKRITLLVSTLTKRRPITCTTSRYITTTTSQPQLIQSTQIPAPHTGHIQLLLLNRPTERNAINWQLLRELREQVEEIAAEGGRSGGGTRALVVGSTGPVFCAGADLKVCFFTSLLFLSNIYTTLSRALCLVSTCLYPLNMVSEVSRFNDADGLLVPLTKIRNDAHSHHRKQPLF